MNTNQGNLNQPNYYYSMSTTEMKILTANKAGKGCG